MLKKNELPNEKDDALKGTEWAKEKKQQRSDREVQPFDHLAQRVTTAFICSFRAVQHTSLLCQEESLGRRATPSH